MTEEIIKYRQWARDKKFHEYKLAALTGFMTSWDHKPLSSDDADSVAVYCDMMARAMQEEDERDESGG